MTSRTGPGGAPFALTKWYFDCVAADGRVVIGYWASLAWRRLRLTWQNVVLYEPGRPPVRRSSLAPAPPPDLAAGAIRWRAPALGCDLAVESRQPPFAARLLADGAGVVDWQVEAPAAQVAVTLRGFAPVEGPGYAERILLTVPPWRLPIRELRWGRWLDAAASRSVVWIDWRGAAPRTWVFVDGALAPEAQVTDECVGVGAGGVSVVLGDRRTLEALAFAEITASIPVLQAVVPKSLLALRQTRWCSAGTLQENDAAALGGRAIHEVVVFR
jgi:hypothetical protein